MKILFVGGSSINQMLKIIYKGFVALGHDVRYRPYLGVFEKPDELKAEIDRFQPDFIFGFIAERWTNKRSIDVVKSAGCPSFYYDFDMPQEGLRHDVGWLKEIISSFTLSSSTDDSEMTKALFKSAGHDVKWCPPMFDPTVVGKYNHDLAADVCCVGSGYNDGPYKGNKFEKHNRTETIKQLEFLPGVNKIRLVGQRWPDGWPAEPCHFDDQWDYYASAKINIGTMIAVPPGISRAMNFRPVLCMGSGGFLLQEWHLGISDCFNTSSEMPTWDTYETLKSSVQYYLAHDGERKQIAEAGREAVLSRYSNVRWCNQICEWVNER